MTPNADLGTVIGARSCPDVGEFGKKHIPRILSSASKFLPVLRAIEDTCEIFAQESDTAGGSRFA